MSKLDFDLPRSLKFKLDGEVGFSIPGFLLVFNSNIRPNFLSLLVTNLQNRNDLDSDIPRSLKVKADGDIGLLICDIFPISIY